MAKGNRSNAGGGIASRVNVTKPVRTGAPARGINPGHVAQTGTALGNRAMDKQTNYRGEPKFTAGPAGGSVPLGNATALTAGQGAGTGRTVSRCGSQSAPPPAPSIKGRDILSDYGPDYQNSRTRRQPTNGD